MNTKRALVLLFVVVAVLCVLNISSALADPIPPGTTNPPLVLEDIPFYDDYLTTQLALVDCTVSQYTSGDYAGKYLYTYQITGTSPTGLSFFSVAVLDDVSINPISYVSGAVNPSVWGAVNDPPQSIDARFADTIDNGDTSALLWLISDGSPELALSSVFGTKAGIPVIAFNQLYSPVPEPATLVLFGLGGLSLIRRKK